MSLAAKLPYDHAYAGGFSGIGSQPLPTDADAIDYLSRMAAADGAGVETGVATAVDAFFRDLKVTPGLFDAIKASCILCGARTLSGALVPLAGTAPTNNNFVAADYNRETGLKGDGSTKYLDSNRDLDDDPLNDQHASVYVASVTSISGRQYMGGNDFDGSTGYATTEIYRDTNDAIFRSRSPFTNSAVGSGTATGFYGLSRDNASNFNLRVSSTTASATRTSGSLTSTDIFIFCRSLFDAPNAYSDGRLAFYSIGESLDLEALDDAVSALVTAIGAAV